jgi:outer membrane receptor protein involved in Fe transport
MQVPIAAAPARPTSDHPAPSPPAESLPYPMFLSSVRFSAALAAAVLASLAQAQSVPAPRAGGDAGPPSAVVLSPFEVKTDGDVGYVATNSLAGSRLNSALRDTPAIIDVFTKEFLADIGATNLEQAMVYANNSQIDDGDAERVNSGLTQTGASNSFRFRSRGILAGTTRNYFETRLSTNFYNVERLDDTRGPNSVLFGIGSAGGSVNNSPKRALLGGRAAEFQFQGDNFDSFRAAADLNLPVVPRKFGVRLNALHDEKKTWRDYLGTTRRAATLAATYRPFAATELRFDAEKGEVRGTIGRNYPVNDGITRWWNNGQPVFATTAAAAPSAAQAALGVNRPLTAVRLVHVENQDYVMNVQNAWGTVADTPYNSSILNDPARVPHEAFAPGPGGRTRHDFENVTLVSEHRFTRDLAAEIGFYHELGTWQNYDLGGSNVIATGDPNGLLRNPANVVALGGFRPATDAAGNLVNPNAGRTYYETAWQRRNGRTASDNARATLAYEKDLGRFGRHRMAALAQHQVEDSLTFTEREAWLGAPFNNEPTNDNNAVWRRAYVVLGDSGSQRVPDPLARSGLSFAYPGRAAPLVSGWIPNGGGTKTTRTIASQMFAVQSSWWANRIVTTFGLRRDALVQERTTTVREAAGIWAGTAGIQVFNAASPTQEFEFTGRTTTAGVVVHPLPWLSVFGNVSRNLGLPTFTQRIGPDGGVPPPPKGEGFDAGFMVSLRQDRIVARASYFETTARDQSASMGVDNAFTANYDNIVGILEDPNGDGNRADQLYTAAQMAKYPTLRPRSLANADVLDNENRGFEARVTANVGDNLRFIVNYSYSFQERSNAYKHTYPKFQELDRLIADVRAAHPGVDVLGARGAGGETLAALVARNWEDLEGRKLDFGNAVGNRAHKANFFANYTFKRGRLNGWAVGFGGRYLGPNHAGRIYTAPGTPPAISGGNVGVGINGPEVYGNDSLQFDAMLRYAPRVGWLGRNGRWSLQLNVRNLFDEHDISIRRYKTDGVTLDRFALTDPREIVLSSTLRF